MSNLIWRPLCPLCEHPERLFRKTVHTTIQLTIHSNGSVTFGYPHLILDVIGNGLQPEHLQCGVCHQPTNH